MFRSNLLKRNHAKREKSNTAINETNQHGLGSIGLLSVAPFICPPPYPISQYATECNTICLNCFEFDLHAKDLFSIKPYTLQSGLGELSPVIFPRCSPPDLEKLLERT